MSAGRPSLASAMGVECECPFLDYPKGGPLSRLELENSMETQKFDHSLDLGLQSLQYDLAGILRKPPQDAQQESDSRAVDEIHIRHFDFSMNKGVAPKRSDLLLKLWGPARIQAGPKNFKPDGFSIGMRIKKSFHRWPTYNRACAESKWPRPLIALGVPLP